MGWGAAGNAATTRPTTSLPPAYLFIASCRLTAARHCSAVQAELVRLRGQMDEQVPQLEQVLADTGVWQEAPAIRIAPAPVPSSSPPRLLAARSAPHTLLLSPTNPHPPHTQLGSGRRYRLALHPLRRCSSGLGSGPGMGRRAQQRATAAQQRWSSGDALRRAIFHARVALVHALEAAVAGVRTFLWRRFFGAGLCHAARGDGSSRAHRQASRAVSRTPGSTGSQRRAIRPVSGTRLHNAVRGGVASAAQSLIGPGGRPAGKPCLEGAST